MGVFQALGEPWIHGIWDWVWWMDSGGEETLLRQE